MSRSGSSAFIKFDFFLLLLFADLLVQMTWMAPSSLTTEGGGLSAANERAPRHSLSFLLDVKDDSAIHVICTSKSANNNNNNNKKSNLINVELPDHDTCRDLRAAV